jgi:hypothetical protein
VLPPIVEVDISDIAIKSGMTYMVKAIILVIKKTPKKTYRIAQYIDSWNRFHFLLATRAIVDLDTCPVARRASLPLRN